MTDNIKKYLMTSLSLPPSNVLVNNQINLSLGVDFTDLPTAGMHLDPQEKIFSNYTKEVMNQIRGLQVQSSAVIESFSNSETLDETLFDVRAKIKILISQVSMYLSEEWRERLYRQIDILHDPDDWEDEDRPISLQSFKTFLKWFFLSKPERPPGFGLSSNGNFIAAWAVDKNKLILEFLTNDTVKWIVTKYYDGEPERATGVARSSRIIAVLAPYKTEEWFAKKR